VPDNHGEPALDALMRRIERVESRLEVSELAHKYAHYADERNIESLTDLFEPEGDFGVMGHGREELAAFFERVLRRFYRSMHQVVGQLVTLDDVGTGKGTTYCRAEHEDGNTWIVMMIRYRDFYRRVDGRWYFSSRDVQHWYCSEILSRPGDPQFQAWPGHEAHVPVLPGAFKTWASYWERAPSGTVERLTSAP
jgi:hypothetical protein